MKNMLLTDQDSSKEKGGSSAVAIIEIKKDRDQSPSQGDFEEASYKKYDYDDSDKKSEYGEDSSEDEPMEDTRNNEEEHIAELTC